MSTDLGTAKGSIELDFGKMDKDIKSAISELEKIDATSKRTDAEMKLLEATARKTGEAFLQSAKHSKELQNQLNNAQSKVNTYEKAMVNLANDLATSKKQQTQLGDAIKTTKASYSEATANVKLMQSALQDAKLAQAALAKSAGATSTEMTTAKNSVKQQADALREAKQQQSAYSSELRNLENAQKKLTREIANAEKQMDTFGTECINAKADVANLQRQLAASLSVTSKMGQYMANVGNQIEKFGKATSKAGTFLNQHVTAPLLAAGGASVKFATDVENSAAKVSTIADENVVSFDKMQDSARKTSDVTGKAWSEINESIYQYISATGDSVGATESAETAVKSAIGGFTDTATAVDGLTTVMNAYGLKGPEAMQKVADMMLETQNVGKTTFGEMAQYIGQVASVASSANIPMEELFGAIATLTSRGVKTATAVEGLRAAISNIVKPSEKATKLAESLGLEWNAAALESKGLQGVMSDVATSLSNVAPKYAELVKENDAYTTQLNRNVAKIKDNEKAIADLTAQNVNLKKSMDEAKSSQGKQSAEYKSYSEALQNNVQKINELKNANKGLNNEQTALKKSVKDSTAEIDRMANASDSQIGAYAELFGSIRGLNTALILSSKEGSAAWNDFTNEIVDSAGATEDAFKKMTNTDAAKFSKQLNEIKNTAVDVGVQVLPVLSDILKGVGDLVNSFSSLDKHTQEVIVKAGLITAVAGPVLKTVGMLTTGVGTITKGTGKLLQKLGETRGGMVAVSESTATASEATASFGSSLAGIATPAGVATVAVTGIGLALKGAYDAAERNDLAGRFGDVALSADEARKAAENLTKDPWTMELYTNVNAETSQNIADQMRKIFNDAQEQVNAERIDATIKLKTQLDAGEITQEEFDNAKAKLEAQANAKLQDITLNQLRVNVSQVETLFPEINEKSKSDFVKSLTVDFNELWKDYTSGETGWTAFWLKFTNLITSGYDELGPIQQENVQKLLEQMKPQADQLEALKEQYVKSGQAVPESVTKGLADYNLLQAMTGSTNAMFSMLADNISGSESAVQSYTAALLAGKKVPDGIREGIDENIPGLTESLYNMYTQLNNNIALSSEQLTELAGKMGFDLTGSLANALTQGGAQVQLSTVEMLANVRAGAELSRGDIMALMDNFGIDIPRSIASGIAKQSADAQVALIEAIMSLPTATASQQEDIKALMQSYGIDDANAFIQAVQNTTNGAYGGKVDVELNNPEEAADNWLTRFWNWITGKSKKRSSEYGARPQRRDYRTYDMNMRKEKKANNSYRDVAMVSISDKTIDADKTLYTKYDPTIQNSYKIMSDAGAFDFTFGNNTAEIDSLKNIVTEMGKQLSKAISEQTITADVTVEMSGGDILLDKERVGRQVAPTVSRVIATRK